MSPKSSSFPFAAAIATRPLVVATLGWYSLFLVLTYTSGWIGALCAFAWPEILLIATQKLIPPGAPTFLAAQVLGFIPVWVFAGAMQRLPRLKSRPRLALGVSVLAWYVPLGVISIAALGVWKAFGSPYAE